MAVLAALGDAAVAVVVDVVVAAVVACRSRTMIRRSSSYSNRSGRPEELVTSVRSPSV